MGSGRGMTEQGPFQIEVTRGRADLGGIGEFGARTPSLAGQDGRRPSVDTNLALRARRSCARERYRVATNRSASPRVDGGKRTTWRRAVRRASRGTAWDG